LVVINMSFYKKNVFIKSVILEKSGVLCKIFHF
jgi:hypothetical protein